MDWATFSSWPVGYDYVSASDNGQVEAGTDLTSSSGVLLPPIAERTIHQESSGLRLPTPVSLLSSARLNGRQYSDSMPATRSSSPSTPSTGNVLLFVGLVLFILVVSICVAIRRRETQRLRGAALNHAPTFLSGRPLHHDVHLLAGSAPTWSSIQPLAVWQTQVRPSQQQKYSASRWPTIKPPALPRSPSSQSDTSLATETSTTLLDDCQIFPIDFDRHLRIAILIAMPLPLGPRAPFPDVAADANMVIGVVDTSFSTLDSSS
ncbi:hypothetical protein C8R47DRAFT_1137533 [Mycena vitilis]|nr:hypothetical protein C8R47DRAFT_1137533 [Mycena vitilis]